MKEYYPLIIFDQRFQIGYVTQRNQNFVLCKDNLGDNNFFVIITKHTELKMISDGHENSRIELFQMIRPNFDVFMKKNKPKDDTLTDTV